MTKFKAFVNTIGFIVITILINSGLQAEEKSSEALYKKIQSQHEHYTQIRRELHTIAEVGYDLPETTEYIKQKLTELGYEEIYTNVGKKGSGGIVALLRTGRPGKTVAVRADMDGLPIQELTGLPYQSHHEKKMHACGHDGHMTSLLLAAQIFMEKKDELNGTIKIIFQPAEESGAGAKSMIDDGVLLNPNVDAIFGLHNWPLGKGVVATKTNTLTASALQFEVVIEGKGGHGASPELTINPIILGMGIIENFMIIAAQGHAATDPVIINVGAFNAGDVGNVVPDKATILGTVRATSPKTFEHILEKMKKCVEAHTAVFGAKGILRLVGIPYPPTINTKEETNLVMNTAKEIIPDESIITLEAPVTQAEDFSFYLEKVPGCFFFVGSGKDRALHKAQFDFNDDILPLTSYMLTKSVINYLMK